MGPGGSGEAQAGERSMGVSFGSPEDRNHRISRRESRRDGVFNLTSLSLHSWQRLAETESELATLPVSRELINRIQGLEATLAYVLRILLVQRSRTAVLDTSLLIH